MAHKIGSHKNNIMEVIDLTADNNEGVVVNELVRRNGLRLEIEGPPKALPRMRNYRNGFFNPARGAMNAFRAAARQQCPQQGVLPIYPGGVALEMEIKLYMKRPNTDFRPGGRLRSALALVRPIRPDIDNLAKFVLDSLNGIAYKDDCQVVKLVVYKLMEHNCGGERICRDSGLV